MSWFQSADKIADGVVEIAKKGMTIWDASKFTPQEQLQSFKDLVIATMSAATARSRRHLLWALIVLISIAFFTGLYYNETGQTVKFDGVIDLVDRLYIGQGFVAAIAFYYLTHAFGQLSKK